MNDACSCAASSASASWRAIEMASAAGKAELHPIGRASCPATSSSTSAVSPSMPSTPVDRPPRDMRIVERGEHPCLALQARAAVRVAGERGRQFNRDLTSQPAVTRPIHFAHPACAQQRRDDLVRADAPPGRKRHRVNEMIPASVDEWAGLSSRLGLPGWCGEPYPRRGGAVRPSTKCVPTGFTGAAG